MSTCEGLQTVSLCSALRTYRFEKGWVFIVPHLLLLRHGPSVFSVSSEGPSAGHPPFQKFLDPPMVSDHLASWSITIEMGSYRYLLLSSDGGPVAVDPFAEVCWLSYVLLWQISQLMR
jgi:hypothetical protein